MKTSKTLFWFASGMMIFQIRNGLLRFTQAGMSLYNPSHYDTHIVIPLSKIRTIEMTDTSIWLKVNSEIMYIWHHSSRSKAEENFRILIKVLEEPVKASEVNPKPREGPAPDAWAMEQLK